MNFFFLLIALINFKVLAANYVWDIDNQIGFDFREFHKDAAYPNQKNTYSSFFKSEIYIELSEQVSFISEPYYRYDHNDKNRSLFDFKENNFIYLENNYEIKFGISEVFWGITESKNLVDIINTIDYTDGDQKAKLGQPMVSYSTFSDKIGLLELYFLPTFKKPSQIGEKGRLRFSKPIERHNVVYEGGAGENVPSWAFKWERSIRNIDLSIQGFRGNSRESSVIPLIENNTLKYFAGYERVTQLGSYLQAISGPFINKIEVIKRNGQKNSDNVRENRLFEKKWDITAFIEYSNDDRGNDSVDILQNDLFIGTRLMLNDVEGTELTTFSTFDLDGGGNTALVKLGSRLSENMRFTGIYQAYWSTNNKDILYSFRRDNYFGLKAVRYF